jgi:hypothetical protein
MRRAIDDEEIDVSEPEIDAMNAEGEPVDAAGPDRRTDILGWPVSEDGATIDAMVRAIGAEAMLVDAEKQQMLDQTPMVEMSRDQAAIHQLSVLVVLNATGLIAVLQELSKVSPELAAAMARDHWALCDSGDAVEVLWDYLREAGVDPEALRAKA